MEPRIILSLVFIGIVAFLIFKTRAKGNTSIPSTELRINLLPNYYKQIGLITVIISLAITILLNYIDSYDLFDFTSFGFALGLSIICLSKEKIEDEMIKELRMNTFFKSFYIGLFSFLIFASLNSLVNGKLSEFSADFPIVILTLVYLSEFRKQKKLLASS